MLIIEADDWSLFLLPFEYGVWGDVFDKLCTVLRRGSSLLSALFCCVRIFMCASNRIVLIIIDNRSLSPRPLTYRARGDVFDKSRCVFVHIFGGRDSLF